MLFKFIHFGSFYGIINFKQFLNLVMVHFDCDYMAGAHSEILDALVRTNVEQTCGYGGDAYCDKARAFIRRACSADNAAVYFMVGGTQTNAAVIDGLLARTQGVISADTGHINVHEAGAIELSGHKVITLPSHSGKLDANEVEEYLKNFYADETWCHMVEPGAVYISFPTELGTLYRKPELEALSTVCKKYRLPLYVDGARLGYGLAASQDVTLKDLAALADVFYIGGTKMGALFGEAVVCRNTALLPKFFSLMKSRGSVLAKGRLLGLQFMTFFTNDLYMRIGNHGVEMSQRLRKVFEHAGFTPFIDSPTNQQFFELPNELIDRLSESVSFEYWGPRGEKCSQVRFVTSWETKLEDVEVLEKALKE